MLEAPITASLGDGLENLEARISVKICRVIIITPLGYALRKSIP